MGEARFTIQVDEDTKAELTKLARASNRTAAQFLRDLVEDYVRRQREEAAHDAWFRQEVREGIREADAASEKEWIPQAQVMTEVRAALEAHIAAKAGK